MQAESEIDSFDITGVIVRSRPEKVAVVTEQLNRLHGVEVHGSNDEGALVVTVEERGGEKIALDTMTTINNISGVISTALVFHQGGSESL